MRRSGVVLTVAAVVATACTACTAAPVPDSGTTRAASPTLASTRASTEASTEASTRAMTGYLDGLVRTRQFRGSVEVRLGDRVLLSRGFDTAGNGKPNGPDTRFVIGSITKQFTALGVLLLQEQGRLRVRDRVCAYLPDCPPAWRAITLDQLLTHTSGLYNFTDMGPDGGRRFLARIGTLTPSPEQVTEMFAGRPLEFAPGTRFKYSNSGYVLLGRVVEKVAGQDYGHFLRKEIFEPLGMSDTGYTPGAPPRPDDAIGYATWQRTADTFDTSVWFAAGGICSTAPDMARWNDFLLTGSPALVDQDTLADLLRPRLPAPPLGQYGYGIMTRGSGAATVHFHDGGVPGFASYDEIRPADRLSVTVLSNLESADGFEVSKTLALMAK